MFAKSSAELSKVERPNEHIIDHIGVLTGSNDPTNSVKALKEDRSLPHKCQPPLPSARQHPSYGDCPEVKGILSELLRAGLCDTMFTVSSTLI